MIESNNIVTSAHNAIGKYFRNSTQKEGVKIEKEGTKVEKENENSLKSKSRVRISFTRRSQRTISTSSSTTSATSITELPTQDLDEQLKLHLVNILSKTINHLFECGDQSPSTSINAPKYLPKLDDFISRIHRRGNLTFVNLLTALLYLIRLKELRPTCKGSYGSGHRLFLAALILANKYLQDGAYHNKTWYKVIEGVYSLNEINQMERELLDLLKYELCVTKVDWLEFIKIMDGKVTRSWGRCGVVSDPGFLFEKATKRIDDPMGPS